MGRKLKDIFTGYQVGVIMPRIQVKTSYATDSGDTEVARVLNPRAIRGGRVVYELIEETYIKKGSAEGKLAQPGDIVMKLTTPYECALITESDAGLLVPSYCIILRGVNGTIADPNFVIGYLSTDLVRADLSRFTASTTNAMLRPKDIMDLDFPDIPLAQQEILGRLYYHSREKQQVLRDMADTEEKIMQGLITNAVVEVTGDGEHGE